MAGCPCSGSWTGLTGPLEWKILQSHSTYDSPGSNSEMKNKTSSHKKDELQSLHFKQTGFKFQPWEVISKLHFACFKATPSAKPFI